MENYDEEDIIEIRINDIDSNKVDQQNDDDDEVKVHNGNIEEDKRRSAPEDEVRMECSLC